MNVLTAKIIASVLQVHGPDATIQSDHPGIDALLGDVRGRMSQNESELGATDAVGATQVVFRRVGGAGTFRRVGGGGGGFVRGAGFRRI
jgi:hypothetical protein